MGETLAAKRDILLDNAIKASVEEFDSVWDSLMEDYLSTGGQAIIDERTTAWEAIYGSETELPE